MERRDSLYRALFERNGDAILIADDGGTIVDANPAACTLLGLGREAIVGRPVAEIVSSEPTTTASLWEAFEARGAQRGEIELRRADGESIPVEYSAVRDVVPGLHASTLRDIRARREADRLRDEILATVSHELRTPLQAILGWASILHDEADAQELTRGLERIESNARTQARLVEDLLDVTRVARGKMQLEVQHVSVAEVVANGVEAAAERARTKGVELEVKVDEDVGAMNADPHRLQQIVWNLTTNAVKFTNAGGRVTVHVGRKGDTVCIEVKDTGVGIADADLPTVFRPFGQIAEGRSRRREGGLGLGLAITKQLVELHGGRIDIESVLGRGSVFRVVLPRAAVIEARGGSERPRTTEPGVLGGLCVLLCDDDEDTRQVLARMLTRHGAEVVTVGSADEAMIALRERRKPPDVLVSDLAMPQRDGLDLVADVRALGSDRGGAMPAVALTGQARDADVQRALGAGFDAYLPKPVSAEALVTTIRSLATRG